MKTFRKGRYQVRLAQEAADIRAAQALRHRAFFGRPGYDEDGFDALCDHVLVERSDGRLAACFRMRPMRSGAEIGGSYSAQYYDLSALESFSACMVELGRFCIDPIHTDPDILRATWAALTRYVDENEVKILYGCSSFPGADPAAYIDAFAMLKARHLAPDIWRPRPKASEVFAFGKVLSRPPDCKRAMEQMPPLIKTYLMMGGWVSDHAVIDRAMETLHVFTAVEIDAIPPMRKRLLRASAAESA